MRPPHWTARQVERRTYRKNEAMWASSTKEEVIKKIGREVGNGREMRFEKNPTPFESIFPVRLAQ